MSLKAATKGGADGLAVCLAFALELGEVRVGGVSSDFRQRGMLEIALTVVDVGGRHCLCRGPVVVRSGQYSKLCYYDEALVIKRSLLELWLSGSDLLLTLFLECNGSFSAACVPRDSLGTRGTNTPSRTELA